MTTSTTRLAAPAATPTVTAQPPRAARPVLWWAALGVVNVGLMSHVYVSWIASDHFRPVPTGSGPVPSSVKMWAWILQVVFCTLTAVVAVWVVRGCRRQRGLTFDAKLTIAFASMVWLDPAMNFLRQQYVLSSYYVNRGSWLEYIPGWISPNPRGNALALTLYITYLLLVVTSVAANVVMRQLRSRWPQIGAVGLWLVTWAAFIAFDFVLEEFLFIRTGSAAYITAIPRFTVWAGTRWQMPLAESVFFAAVFTAMAMLRFFRDDQGRSVVERGIDRVRAGARTKEILSLLAVIGFAFSVMLTFDVIMNAQTLFAGEPPTGVPSHLLNGVCGAGTPYPCPGPGVPIIP